MLRISENPYYIGPIMLNEVVKACRGLLKGHDFTSCSLKKDYSFETIHVCYSQGQKRKGQKIVVEGGVCQASAYL